MNTKLINTIRKFHRDEEGLETMQVVTIMGIAAMIMITTATVGQQAADWMNGKWMSFQGANVAADASNTASLQINSALGMVPTGILTGGT